MTGRRILVLSAGDSSGVNFCRSVGQSKKGYFVVGCDSSAYRLQFPDVDKRVQSPDPKQEDEYLRFVGDLVEREKIALIYAADTNQELHLLSEHRGRFDGKVFLPAVEAVRFYEDKWRTYEVCQAAGVRVPESRRIDTPGDVEDVVSCFGEIWLRATHGSGGRGSLRTRDAELAKAWVRHYDGFGRFMAARVLPGKMATWIGIWWHGELVVGQGRERLSWEYAHLSPSGVTGITGAQQTTDDAEITSTAIACIKAAPFEPHGLVSVDMTYDARGSPNITEIQASRFYSSIHFLTEAGLNLPDIYLELGLSGCIPDLPKRQNPLASGLLWLKSVDSLPILTTPARIAQNISLPYD